MYWTKLVINQTTNWLALASTAKNKAKAAAYLILVSDMNHIFLKYNVCVPREAFWINHFFPVQTAPANQWIFKRHNTGTWHVNVIIIAY